MRMFDTTDKILEQILHQRIEIVTEPLLTDMALGMGNQRLMQYNMLY